MPDQLHSPGMTYTDHLLAFRTLYPSALIASGRPEANLLALCRYVLEIWYTRALQGKSGLEQLLTDPTDDELYS